jgi:hypothetical protein
MGGRKGRRYLDPRMGDVDILNPTDDCDFGDLWLGGEMRPNELCVDFEARRRNPSGQLRT